jgi:hypothetical protein
MHRYQMLARESRGFMPVYGFGHEVIFCEQSRAGERPTAFGEPQTEYKLICWNWNSIIAHDEELYIMGFGSTDGPSLGSSFLKKRFSLPRSSLQRSLSIALTRWPMPPLFPDPVGSAPLTLGSFYHWVLWFHARNLCWPMPGWRLGCGHLSVVENPTIQSWACQSWREMKRNLIIREQIVLDSIQDQIMGFP